MKCISEPSETDEEIYTLDSSNKLGWSDAMIRGFCRQQEEKALNNPKKPDYPVYEPYAILKF